MRDAGTWIAKAILMGGVLHHEKPSGTHSSRPRHGRHGGYCFLLENERVWPGVTDMWFKKEDAAKAFVWRLTNVYEREA